MECLIDVVLSNVNITGRLVEHLVDSTLPSPHSRPRHKVVVSTMEISCL